jgi:hypothetical protein
MDAVTLCSWWCGLQVLKAVTAGLFMNAAQFDHTEYDPRASSDTGSNVYRLLRHMQPGEGLGFVLVT